MSTIAKIGFIGFGKMAEAIASGFINSGRLDKSVISFTEKHSERAATISSTLGFKSMELKELVQENDLVFIAIKPQQLNDLLPQLKEGPIYVSILAGAPISAFEKGLPNTAIVRVMPNTPALVSKGMFAVSANKIVSKDDYDYLQNLLSSLGEVVVVDEEKMDAVTGISGSGPAFVYSLANAFIQKATQHGFDEKTARLLAAQTFAGASDMILKSSKPVTELISDVRSPNGTTDAGLKVLETSTIQAILNDAIEASISRSKELS
ncbi:pyrroline-5-carboxylate reductase [Candidatus Marinamargulisbacteria bacterium SCGC AAA071-K20]|nr:pyrroline-5-carboxylate reductase [Candidatus Marinamargulisbacteria bacterium SCGC AAA071-K20]